MLIDTQILKLDEVYKACRKFYRKKLLLAQSPHRYCLYTSGEYRCAIGWGLNAHSLAVVAKKGLMSQNVYALRDEGIIACSKMTGLMELQEIHDFWCKYKQPDSDKIFCKLIGLKK